MNGSAGKHLVVATRNAHKLRELAEILVDHVLLELPAEVELPPEGGRTFEENARIKAEAANLATGLPAIADDSGIVAYALDGAPGVYSARYAGPNADDGANLAKLLAAMQEHDDRRVAYVCALAAAGLAGGGTVAVEGRCEGRLALAPRGTGGFGYDPAFVPIAIGDGRTMAELDPAEKHAISHRGAAARELAARLSRS